jgi:hypothetical protein
MPLQSSEIQSSKKKSNDHWQMEAQHLAVEVVILYD